jgi:hypothetical protein
MDWQRRARAGEPLRVSATAYNAFVEAAIAVKRGSFAGGAGERTESSTRILAVNAGGLPIPRWHGCLITGSADAMTVSDGTPIVKVSLDDVGKIKDSKIGIAAIASEAIAAGGVGLIVVSGVTIAATEETLTDFASSNYLGEFEDGLLVASASGTIRVLGMVAIPTSSSSIGHALVRLESAPSTSSSFLARITDAEPISGGVNRWKYEWHEVEVNASGSFIERVGGRTSGDLGKAYNSVEADNDGNGIEGPGWDLDNAVGNFEIKPIQACVVEMRLQPIDDGAFLPVFAMANVLDGECEEDTSGSGGGP